MPPVKVSCKPRCVRKNFRKSTRGDRAGKTSICSRVKRDVSRPSPRFTTMSAMRPVLLCLIFITGTFADWTISTLLSSPRPRSVSESCFIAVVALKPSTPVMARSTSAHGKFRPVEYEPKMWTSAFSQRDFAAPSIAETQALRAVFSAAVGRTKAQKSRSSSWRRKLTALGSSLATNQGGSLLFSCSFFFALLSKILVSTSPRASGEPSGAFSSRRPFSRPRMRLLRFACFAFRSSSSSRSATSSSRSQLVNPRSAFESSSSSTKSRATIS
mmetsp:Transcript_77092/g.136019  ORF Transcript_77092/g.136019 Transcript_77092/m.136019 type:complete len:271 (-) Transcript_77092:20-832(-)